MIGKENFEFSEAGLKKKKRKKENKITYPKVHITCIVYIFGNSTWLRIDPLSRSGRVRTKLLNRKLFSFRHWALQSYLILLLHKQERPFCFLSFPCSPISFCQMKRTQQKEKSGLTKIQNPSKPERNWGKKRTKQTSIHGYVTLSVAKVFSNVYIYPLHILCLHVIIPSSSLINHNGKLKLWVCIPIFQMGHCNFHCSSFFTRFEPGPSHVYFWRFISRWWKQ